MLPVEMEEPEDMAILHLVEDGEAVLEKTRLEMHSTVSDMGKEAAAQANQTAVILCRSQAVPAW